MREPGNYVDSSCIRLTDVVFYSLSMKIVVETFPPSSFVVVVEFNRIRVLMYINEYSLCR